MRCVTLLGFNYRIQTEVYMRCRKTALHMKVSNLQEKYAQHKKNARKLIIITQHQLIIIDMADITMCEGEGCEIKDTCYRHKAKPSIFLQAYFEPPIKDSVCEYYWNFEG